MRVILPLGSGILACPRMSCVAFPLSLSSPDQKAVHRASDTQPSTPTMLGRPGFVRSAVSEPHSVYDSFLA